MSRVEPASGPPLLSDDLVLQILSRLPVKHLLRCRSVCKLWRRLASDPHFLLLHSQFSSGDPMVLVETVVPGPFPRPGLICVGRQGWRPGFNLDFLKERVKVRASCNGLLCCASIADRGVYYVCNPATRRFKLLPRARDKHAVRYRPNHEATLVGLAYRPATHKLNVAVAGFYRRLPDQLVCYVYDSDTNAWSRFLTACHDEFSQMNRNQAVFAGGSLHWLTTTCSHLLALNLDRRSWGKIPLPDAMSAPGVGSRIYLLELDGLLSVIQIAGTTMSIWVLKDHFRGEWAVVERVHLRCIMAVVANVFPICLSRDLIFMATQRRVLMYRRKDKVWKEMYCVKDSSPHPLWFSAYAFKNTLFPCGSDPEFP